MATKVLMPKLSDTMTDGKILKWLKKEGERIKQGEILVEIESDKADMELEAYDSGILRKILVPEGSSAAIGAAIAIIAEADENISSLLSDAAVSTTQSQQIDISPKEVPVELTSEIDQKGRSESEGLRPASSADSADKTDGRIKASPLAKRLAAEKNIELGSVPGSGPQGRVIKQDIESFLKGKRSFTKTDTPIIPGGYKDIELSLIRRTIAKRMQESKQVVPHFYVTIEIDMDAAIAFRQQLNTTSGSKISFTDILIKAAASALMKHPNINAKYLGNTIRQYGEAHIAIAVALDDGLVTPVLRNCEQKSIPHISSELHDLAERARNRKLKPEEYQGGTFTISNLGMFGVEAFTAIINPPEGAILAVGTIVEKPVVKKERITIGHTMKATLSSDHRIIDGATAAKFLQDFKTFMENPVALLL